MIRKLAAIWCGKCILLLTKILQQGGGTAAPGLYALKIDSQLIESFTRQCKKGSIIITGTNGKTTTSRLISHYFSQSNISFIHNRAGSNLERGIASACISSSDWLGKISADYGLWELDEAAFSKLVEKIKPTKIVLLNLFRDQLDRYGEVDTTKIKWVTALSHLSLPTTIIFNADDPQLVHLAELVSNNNPKHIFVPFSINSGNENSSENDVLSPVETVLCPQCKHKLSMNQIIAGLGAFRCQNCSLKRPSTNSGISNYSVNESGTTGEIVSSSLKKTFSLPLPGAFNLYNFLAAYTYLENSKQNVDLFLSIVKEYKPAFARMEHIVLNKTEFILTLIKNPTGFTESLKTIFYKNSNYSEAIFILNDNYADGKDVSWIWDVAIAKYIPHHIRIIVSGTRCYDMAIRMKYSGFNESEIVVCENLHEIFNNVTTQKIPIFATYTASLELQNYFEKTGVKNKYWNE